MQWQVIAKRQRLTEWRDDQLLAMAAAVNAIATDALPAIEREMLETPQYDTLYDGFDRVRPQLDALIRARFETEVAPLFDSAARRLRAIDSSAEAAALALLRDGWPTLPFTPIETPTSLEPEPPPATGLLADVLRVGAQAATALGDTIRGWTGYEARMRARAQAHVTAVLLVGVPERPSALEQLDAAITDAAETVRGRLA